MNEEQLKRLATRHSNEGKRFAAKLTSIFEQYRKDQRADWLAGPNRDLSVQAIPLLMSGVQLRLNRLAKELREEAHKTVVNAVDKEASYALKWLDEQKPESANKVPPETAKALLVSTLQSDLDGYLQSAVQDVKNKIQRDLTQMALRDETMYRAARAILGVSPADGIRPAYTTSYGRVAAIARTEYSKALNLTTYSMFKDIDGVEFEWVAAICSCKCVACHRELDGQRVRPGELFRSSFGSYLAPPAHTHCRCILVVHRI